MWLIQIDIIYLNCDVVALGIEAEIPSRSSKRDGLPRKARPQATPKE